MVNRPGPGRIVGPQTSNTNDSPPKSRDGRRSAPIYHRVDADGDTSNNAWQRETSVKHIQGPPQPSSANPTENGNREIRRAHVRVNSESSQHSDHGYGNAGGNTAGTASEYQNNNRNSQWARTGPNQQPSSGANGQPI